MTTTFDPRSSLRSSQHRASSQPSNPNLRSSQLSSTSLPSVDFGFDSLRSRMGAFTSRMDTYISNGRADALSSRGSHRSALGEAAEDASLRARAIAQLQGAQASHAATLAREAAETAEMDGAIAGLAASRDHAASSNAATAREIAEVREAIAARERAQRDYADLLGRQRARNAPELAFYEDHLGLRIESPADDLIVFVFVGLGTMAGTGKVAGRGMVEDCEVTLDLSRRDYAVTATTPRLDLEGDGVAMALRALNETRELAPFLKRMRRAFLERVREGGA